MKSEDLIFKCPVCNWYSMYLVSEQNRKVNRLKDVSALSCFKCDHKMKARSELFAVGFNSIFKD